MLEIDGVGSMVRIRLRFRVQGLGFRVQGLGFRVQGFRVQGLGCRIWGLGLRILELRAWLSSFAGLGDSKP